MVPSSGKYIFRFFLGASCALALASGANAATSYYFDNINNGATSNQGNIKESGTDVVVGTITAWSNGDENGPGVSDGTAAFSQSDLDYYGAVPTGGAGVGGEFSPEHSIDNRFAMEFALILFNGGIKINLQEIDLSWNAATGCGGPCSTVRDSDMTIMAFTDGVFDQNTDLNGVSSAGLVPAGWELINHLFDVNNSPTSIGNTSDIASNAWLIGAYNPFISGGSVSSCFTNADKTSKWWCKNKYDGVKLSGLSGIKPPETQVPVPGTALLLGLGLLMVRARARSQC